MAGVHRRIKDIDRQLRYIIFFSNAEGRFVSNATLVHSLISAGKDHRSDPPKAREGNGTGPSSIEQKVWSPAIRSCRRRGSKICICIHYRKRVYSKSIREIPDYDHPFAA